jgi:hypothetical protein
VAQDGVAAIGLVVVGLHKNAQFMHKNAEVKHR